MTPRELAPLPGQAEVASRLVHERRRRAALLAASTAGAVVLLSLVLSARGAGLAGVEPVAPAVNRTATGTPAPVPARATAYATTSSPRDRAPSGPVGRTPEAAHAAARAPAAVGAAPSRDGTEPFRRPARSLET